MLLAARLLAGARQILRSHSQPRAYNDKVCEPETFCLNLAASLRKTLIIDGSFKHRDCMYDACWTAAGRLATRFPDRFSRSMVGSTIGKYRIVEQIGRGGMGTVYRAIDETLDREVAIKMLNADLLTPESLQRFRGEAVALAKLNHPRIATIHELANEGRDVLMVMEYIRGETCETLLARKGPLPVVRAVLVCDQVLDALQHAHAAGIVHRDLKPANVMVTTSGDVKVMDFGISRMSGTEHMTMQGFMMGTPAYMAPEQVRGEEADQRMDLYSAAVMLYCLLTKRLPYEADNSVALIHAQMTNPPTPPRTFRADLPDWIDAILARGLSKSPGDRFQTAAEFRRALDQGSGGVLALGNRSQPDTDDAETIGPMLTPVGVRRPETSVASAPTERIPVPVPPPRSSPTVTLKTPHLVAAGTLLVLLVIGIGILASTAFRRPAQTVATVEPSAAPTPPPAPTPSLAENTADAGAPTPSVPDVAAAAAPTAGSLTATPSLAPGPTSSPPPDASAKTPPVVPSPQTSSARRTGPGAAVPAPAVTPPPPVSPAPSPAPAEVATPGEPERAAAPPAAATPPAANLPPQSFGDMKVLLADGDKTREMDALLSLESDHFVVRNRDNGVVLRSVPYRSLAAATYSRSRRPRWKEDGSAAAIPKSFGGSGFFLKTSKHWLSLQTTSDFLVLRLDDKNVGDVITSLEARTGSKVDRPADRD